LIGDFDVVRGSVESEPPALAFLGPGVYSALEDSVRRFKAFYPKVPLAVVLENDIYATEAIDLRKTLDARIMPIADVTQMGQFILDSVDSSISGTLSGRCSCVGIVQCKGGVGGTSVATSLACSLAKHGRNVALIDLDDVNPQITDWVKANLVVRQVVSELLTKGEVTRNRIKELSCPHSGYSNLNIIPQPERYGEGFHFKADVLPAPSSAEYIQSLIAALSEQYDVIIVDTGKSWGVSTIAALRICEQVFAVIDEDRTSLARTIDILERF